MERGTAMLAGLEVLVLDEADRMLDMGFLPDVKRILRKLPRGRQTMMFSATMPYDIRRLCTEIMKDPVTIEIGLRAPAETVSHALYAVAPTHKNDLLIAVLRQTDTESVLIFTQMKSAARAVYLALQKAKFRVAVIEGDMPQGERQEALDGFRAGKTQILVATDIAARGLDISQISHVINYDMPATVDDYTHRIGRTGRALHTGDAITFVTHEDLEMVVRIEKVLGMELEYKHVTGLPFPPPPWDPLGRPTVEKRDRRRPTRPSLRRGR
jgi:ATP-dependent RNA helicase RhlE